MNIQPTLTGIFALLLVGTSFSAYAQEAPTVESLDQYIRGIMPTVTDAVTNNGNDIQTMKGQIDTIDNQIQVGIPEFISNLMADITASIQAQNELNQQQLDSHDQRIVEVGQKTDQAITDIFSFKSDTNNALDGFAADQAARDEANAAHVADFDLLEGKHEQLVTATENISDELENTTARSFENQARSVDNASDITSLQAETAKIGPLQVKLDDHILVSDNSFNLITAAVNDNTDFINEHINNQQVTNFNFAATNGNLMDEDDRLEDLIMDNKVELGIVEERVTNVEDSFLTLSDIVITKRPQYTVTTSDFWTSSQPGNSATVTLSLRCDAGDNYISHRTDMIDLTADPMKTGMEAPSHLTFVNIGVTGEQPGVNWKYGERPAGWDAVNPFSIQHGIILEIVCEDYGELH